MPGNQVRVGVGVSGAKGAASELDGLRDKFDRLQKQGAKGIGIGIGAGVATKAFDILGSSIGAVGSILGDAKDAAIEEEQSVAKLDAALKANVVGWNGNRDAIEGVLASRMKLGFSDDEQRDSLALLVAATHDSTKALDLQRTAMDLARLKNISLGAASEALVKVEGGQFRLLKSLGIVLADGATQTEALAAVQKVATGQADAFANTSGGKLLASQVKVGEAMERIGQKILPGFVAVTETAADAVVGLVDALDTVKPATDTVGNALGFVHDGVVGWGQAIKGTVAVMDDMLDGTTEGTHVFKKFTPTVAKATEELGELSTKAYDTGKAIHTNVGSMIADAIKLKRSMLDDAQAIVDDYYDVLIARDELYTTNAEINNLRKIASGRKLTHEEQANLHRLEKTQAELEADLAKHGDTQSKEFTATMAKLLSRLKHAHGDEKRAIQAEIIALELLAAKAYEANKAIQKLPSSAFHGPSGASEDDHRAAGGPVTAGQAYIVGENHPEVFVPSENGTILPNAPTAPSGGGSWGGSMTFAPTVVVQGLATPAVKQQIVNELGPLFAAWMRSHRS